MQPLRIDVEPNLENQPWFIHTNEKALKFQQDLEEIDDMLLNTNTINFEELRSESQKTEDDRDNTLKEDRVR